MEEMDWALVKIKGDQVPAVTTGSAGVNKKKKKTSLTAHLGNFSEPMNS